MVNVYAATSGATVCPTAGAAVSEAGCLIVVESKLDSTCGAVVFNTDLCLHSSTASITSSATSTQAVRVLRASASGAAQQTGSAPDSTITQGPSYKIMYVRHRRSVPNEWSANGLQDQVALALAMESLYQPHSNRNKLVVPSPQPQIAFLCKYTLFPNP